MSRLLESFATMGHLPEDSAEEQLHKRFLIYMAVLMSGGGILWGSISFAFGLYFQGLIPLGYTFITIINLFFFAIRKNFPVTRFIQVLISLLLPFFFQWSLGGFAVTGAMMLWSLLALLGSLTFQSTGLATGWLISYVVFTILSGFADPLVRPYAIEISPNIETVFFVTNIIIISSIVVGLMLYFVASRDKANQELVRLTNHLEEMVEQRTRELKETLAHLNAIIDNMADGLLVTDEQGRIARVNPALAEIFALESRAALNGQVSEKLDAHIALLLRQTMNNHEIMADEVELPGGRTGLATAACILAGQESVDPVERECLGSVTVIRDITREKEIDRMKTDFISNVSHELRTPLTSVLGFAKIIQKKFEDVIEPALDLDQKKVKRAAKQVRQNTEIIVSEGERLTTLINSVLDISKMEAGKTEWNMEELGISEVVERAVNATAALFQEKPVKLKTEIDPALETVSGDRDRLIQVVINLLSNAIKFTDEGSITIRAAKNQEGLMQLDVVDTGVGISADDQTKVFDKFQQVGDTLTDKPQGTGLGLPICKQIIEHHQGDIWVSGEPGVGSTFSFTLPFLKDATPERVRTVNLTTLLASLNKKLEMERAGGEEKRKTILITDDDPGIRNLLRQELRDNGYHTIEAKDGMEAVSLLKKHPVDLVILDVMMPKMNGYDVAAILKNDPNTMDIPIMIHSVIEDAERGLNIGVDRYVTKSGDTEGILKEVEELIEQGPSHKHLLVMDEKESTVKTLVDVLRARGYNARGAHNREEALGMIKKEKPDMVIVDALFSKKHDLVQTIKFEKGMENLYFLVLGENEKTGPDNGSRSGE